MTIALQTRLNHASIQEGENATVFLLVQLTAEAAPAEHRMPLNLAGVIDRSGSMHGDKLEYTKKALRFLVDQTVPDDYLAIVTFDDEVETPFPSDHVANKDALKGLIAQIHSGGSTNLSGGMLAGYRQVRTHSAKKRVNRVLLMTDGEANVGVTQPAALIAKVKELNEKGGMQLTTLGVGEGFNEDLLAAMAVAGGGNFYFIAGPDEIPGIFARELQGLLSTVAQGLDVSFTAAPGVIVEGVIGYPPHGTPSTLSMTLPDIYAGETKSLVLQLAVSAAFAGDHSLGSLSVSFTPASGAEEVRLDQSVTVSVTGDSNLLSQPEDAEVAKQVALARSAEALEQAIEHADQGNLHDSSATIMAVAAPMLAMAQQTGDQDLALRANELMQQARVMEAETYDTVARKQMRQQSFQSRNGRRP